MQSAVQRRPRPFGNEHVTSQLHVFAPKAEALPRRPREGAPVREAGAERRKPLSQRADREGQVCVSHKPAFNSELSPPPLPRV